MDIRRRSLRESKGHPLFRPRYQPPIKAHLHLNSSGESTGGSSEGVGSLSLDDDAVRCPSPVPSTSSSTSSSCSSFRDEDGEKKSTPYQALVDFMENDPKWRTERGLGRAVGMYRIHGEIGYGNFARVKLGVHQLLRERVAVKIVEKSGKEPKVQKMLVREVSTLDSLQHPNILRLYEVIETPWKLYLISEWAPAGDLYAKVTLRVRLTEREARPIFTQILSALAFMHANGIVHRDLKAENIFFSTSTHCKVGDFGFATLNKKGELLSSYCGSPPYAAPELFRDEAYEGPPVDIWALGVLLYFMTHGVLPFTAPSIPALKAVILLGVFHVSSAASNELECLINGVLQQSPNERLTISQLLRHNWLRQLRRQDTTALLFPSTKGRAVSTQLPSKQQIQHGLLSLPEEEALVLLKKLGISAASLDSYREEGVRSSVGGIYRILLHKVQQGAKIPPEVFRPKTPPPKKIERMLRRHSQSIESNTSTESNSSEKKVPSKGKQHLRKQAACDEIPTSATCIIL